MRFFSKALFCLSQKSGPFLRPSEKLVATPPVDSSRGRTPQRRGENGWKMHRNKETHERHLGVQDMQYENGYLFFFERLSGISN